ncbi:protein of unknown function [Chitinophaga sp. YR573]|uniref:BT_3987 domain-containing protein n=1 Tax=Chitinophaga sp. YR573 TaxID=1881040 RepID=UPI0008B2A75A|nr:DUF1735 domain-containing protein [Chitinophaga sp. YR573]SEV87893.1 protein of unknown function [Chitinophaga sp. YR573]
MMKYKSIHIAVVFVLGTLLLTSCLKDNVKDLGTEGDTFIKFLEAPQNALYFTPFTTVDTIGLFSVRKDANSSQSLKTATVVKLTSLPELIDTYNTTNSTTFEALPDSLYTLTNSSFVANSTGYDLTFSSGDFAREFSIALDGSKWDVTHKYALAFTLSVTGTGITALSDLDTILVFLSVKNKYDGTYSSTGYFYHPSSPRALSATKDVKTAGSNSITVSLGDLGGSGYTALITVDDATNALTITAAAGAGGAPYTMFTDGLPSTNPGYTAGWSSSALCNNTYDPATGTFYVRYGYLGGTGWRVTEEILTKQ